MSGVLSDSVCSANAALGVNFLQRQQRGTDDFLSSSCYPVQFVSLLCSAVLKPGRNAVNENALSGASAKDGHGWNWEVHLL